MMELNKEILLLQGEIKKFAREVIAEKVDEFDKNGIFPIDNIKRLAEMGILGATIPETYGGCLLDALSLMVCLEEIGKVCPSTALIILTHNILFAYPLVRFGNEEQKKILSKLAAGEVIGGFAERSTNDLRISAGSDFYKISGSNPILLNGVADGPFILFIESDNSINAFVVDEKIPGVIRNKKDNIIGMNAGGITEVVFDNCLIPVNNRLGREGEGRFILEEITNFANLGFSAINLGISEGAMENAIKYAKERVQFGEPIINFGMVREMIIEMRTKIEAIRLLIYDAARLYDAQKDFILKAGIARYLSNRAAAEITTDAIQVYGGYGYMKDYPVERYFRDAQVSRVLCSSNIDLRELIISRTI
ncbi:MAG: acyl-CoA dehydrogenase family protein [candidate division WOR-3 bacterium]|nr:acyl-CoA dehydrogenase family protein [candidate division WOR-3 bacterium]